MPPNPLNVARHQLLRKPLPPRPTTSSTRPAGVVDERASANMPSLTPRPSSPYTPAEIIRGPTRWPGILVLGPVYSFSGPGLIIATDADTQTQSPASEAASTLDTPGAHLVGGEVASVSDKLREIEAK